jgi:peptide/nickel transport system substrate-binding protein
MSKNPRALAAAGLLAFSLALAACSPSPATETPAPSGSAPTTAAAGPVEGGELTWAVEVNLSSVNPHRNGQAKANHILRNAYDTYFYLQEDGTYEPWLAESLDISEDGLTVTVKLRSGITFSDGAVFDSAAALANFDKVRSQGYLTSIPGGLKFLKEVTAPDASTLVFELEKSDALFFQYLAAVGSAPLSPASLELPQTTLEVGGPELAGIGPFTITSYTPSTEITFEKRADYAWAPESIADGQKAAHLDKVVYRTLIEGSARTGALEQGQVQAASDIQPLDVTVFEDNSDFQYIRSFVTGTPYTLYLNVSKPPLDDIKVREAFVLGSDLDAIVASVYSGAFERAWAPASTLGPWDVEDLVGWNETDVEKANQLLDEAGWAERNADGIRTKDGATLTVRTVTEAPFVRESRDQVNLAISAALKQNVGIDYQYEIVDLGSGTERVDANDYETFDNSYGSADPTGGFDVLYHSDPTRGGIARGKFRDAKVDALIDVLRFSTDLDERVDAAHEFQNYVTDQFYVLPIYQTQDNLAAVDALEGIVIASNGQVFSAYTVWLAE